MIREPILTKLEYIDCKILEKKIWTSKKIFKAKFQVNLKKRTSCKGI